MKLKITLLYPLIVAFLLPLYAEEATAVEDEKELPEYSDPPYSVGDRAFIQGYYKPLSDGVSLNFRIRNNRMYVYWVDADDLIVEPQASSGNTRFLAGVRGKNYYALEPLQGEDGLGSVGGPVLEPHLFTVIVSLKKEESEEFDSSFNLRYISAMADKRETRDFNYEEEKSEGSKDKKDRKSYY